MPAGLPRRRGSPSCLEPKTGAAGARIAASRWRSALACATLLLAATSPAAGALRCGDRAPDPSRIAVAGGSLVEILYALGEQDRIVAVDSTANYPAAATALPQIGYVRNLSAEGLLSLSPTLVLGEHDMGPPAVVEQLEGVGIDLLHVPERFDSEDATELLTEAGFDIESAAERSETFSVVARA